MSSRLKSQENGQFWKKKEKIFKMSKIGSSTLIMHKKCEKCDLKQLYFNFNTGGTEIFLKVGGSAFLKCLVKTGENRKKIGRPQKKRKNEKK